MIRSMIKKRKFNKLRKEFLVSIDKSLANLRAGEQTPGILQTIDDLTLLRMNVARSKHGKI